MTPPTREFIATADPPLVRGNQTFSSITDTISRIVEDKTRLNWIILFMFTGSLMLMLFGLMGYLIYEGIGVWGNNNPVGWGWDITNFVWWVVSGTPGR